MCLQDDSHKKVIQGNMKTRMGWKTFAFWNTSMNLDRRLKFHVFFEYPLIIGRWIKQSNSDPFKGFHILLNKVDHAIPIKYRNASYKGIDGGSHYGEPTIIAKEICIPVAEVRKALKQLGINKETQDRFIQRSKRSTIKRKKKLI